MKMKNRVIFTEEMVETIKENYKNHSARQMSDLIYERTGERISIRSIQHFCHNHQYVKRKTEPYSEELKKFIKDNYDYFTSKELVKIIEIKFKRKINPKTMQIFLKRNKITKSSKCARFYSSEAKKYIFENSKKYTIEEMVKKLYEKFSIIRTPQNIRNYYCTNNLEYKKVRVPALIGSELKSKEATRIKVDKHKYVQKNRYLYEKYNNVKLKSNECVIFLDGNENNYDKENLIAVKYGTYQNIIRTLGGKEVSPELRKLIITTIQFKELMNKRGKYAETETKIIF